MKNNINRRAFIKGTSIAGVAGIVASSSSASAMMLTNQSELENSNLLASESGSSAGKLSYNKDGKFKILQLTDTHYVSGDPRSEKVLENINVVLDAEKPDLVIHTGDLIFGKPAEASICEVLDPISKREIPFAVVFGNHDDEFDKTRRELFEIVKSIPHSLISTTEGIFGVTNYILTLASPEGKDVDRVLYLFDSNAYSGIEGIKGYDHVRFDQIAWYRDRSRNFTKRNEGKPVSSLAFFHIPLPEHKNAACDDGAILIGTRGEAVCSSAINSGLFGAMKEMGDVQALFHGHDHNNDYAVSWNKLFFIYGRFSGCDTVYNDLKPNGARVIELTAGEKSFRSWIRLSDGSMIQDLKYPDNFLRK